RDGHGRGRSRRARRRGDRGDGRGRDGAASHPVGGDQRGRPRRARAADSHPAEATGDREGLTTTTRAGVGAEEWICDYLGMSARVGAAQADGADGINDSMASLRAQVEGDRAFERLYRKYVSDVYRYALALVRSEADAEDVTQTTFLNAFRAYQRGERPRKDKSWLLAIAHNVCRQRFRHQSRRPQEVELDEDLAEAAVPEEGPSADDLVRALQQLSFNQRSALVMRELEGRPYAEIGEILELPVSAVETLLFRARRALREQLESSITCGEAEHLLSLQLDGRLARTDRGALRAHLRSCQDCSRTARSQRAQRAAWKSLAVVPLPGSLSSLLGGGGAAVGIGTGVAVKVAALGASA